MKKVKFIFEELDVWKKAVDFSIKVIDFTENINTDRRHFRLIEQFEAASTSIALNIAEGKGSFSKKEFILLLLLVLIKLIFIYRFSGKVKRRQNEKEYFFILINSLLIFNIFGIFSKHHN